MAWWAGRVGFLARWELALIATVAASVVTVNKVVIDDRGNTWSSLILHAAAVGLGTVMVIRFVRERARDRAGARAEAAASDARR